MAPRFLLKPCVVMDQSGRREAVAESVPKVRPFEGHDERQQLGLRPSSQPWYQSARRRWPDRMTGWPMNGVKDQAIVLRVYDRKLVNEEKGRGKQEKRLPLLSLLHK